MNIKNIQFKIDCWLDRVCNKGKGITRMTIHDNGRAKKVRIERFHSVRIALIMNDRHFDQGKASEIEYTFDEKGNVLSRTKLVSHLRQLQGEFIKGDQEVHSKLEGYVRCSLSAITFS